MPLGAACKVFETGSNLRLSSPSFLPLARDTLSISTQSLICTLVIYQREEFEGLMSENPGPSIRDR